jgi:hypothetical protein
MGILLYESSHTHLLFSFLFSHLLPFLLLLLLLLLLLFLLLDCHHLKFGEILSEVSIVV